MFDKVLSRNGTLNVIALPDFSGEGRHPLHYYRYESKVFQRLKLITSIWRLYYCLLVKIDPKHWSDTMLKRSAIFITLEQRNTVTLEKKKKQDIEFKDRFQARERYVEYVVKIYNIMEERDKDKERYSEVGYTLVRLYHSQGMKTRRHISL